MKLLPALALAGITVFSVSAFATPQSERVRGAIQSFNQNSLTIHTRDGSSAKVTLNGGTKLAYVVRSSLSQLGKGDYIGVATKHQSGRLVALEVSIFPKSMSGMGEGHYPWDRLRDTTLIGNGTTSSAMTNGNVTHASMTRSAMTNGTVSGASSGSLPMTQSAMTNGTLSHVSGNAAMTQSAMTNGAITSAGNGMGGKQITVTYNGKQEMIWVPPSAAIVRFQPASRSALEQGAKAFIITSQENGQLTAKFVAVGKDGLTPPM